MNPGYDWASRAGNWLLLTYVTARARHLAERVNAERRPIRRALLWEDLGPAQRREVEVRAAYDEWAARRPS